MTDNCTPDTRQEKVLRPKYHGGSSKVYHTQTDECYVAKRLLDGDRGQWIDREIMEAWGWHECKRCSGEAVHDKKQGPSLAHRLHQFGKETHPDIREGTPVEPEGL